MISGFVSAMIAFAICYWLYYALLLLLGGSARFFSWGLLAMVSSGVVSLLVLSLGAVGSLTFIATFFPLWVLALNFMAGIANSVTLQMLNSERIAKGRPFTEADVLHDYDQRSNFSGRLYSLHQTGLIERVGDGFRLTKKGETLVAPFRFFQWLFSIENTG